MIKTLAALMVFGFVTVGAFGQGQIAVNNKVTADGIDAPVTDQFGVRLEGPNYSAQLYAGTQGTAESGLVAATGGPTDFRTGAAAGYINSYTATVSGVPTGSRATIQLRAWDNGGGLYTTYEAALAAGQRTGKSNVFDSQPLGGGITPPPNMIGLAGFALVPEPSTLAMGALGLGTLLMRRRRK